MQSFQDLDHEARIATYSQTAGIALKAYDVDTDLISIDLLTSVNNATFKVAENTGSPASRQFALRINRPPGEPVAAIRSELRWLQSLRRETTLKTPNPVRTRSGDPLTTVSPVRISGVCSSNGWLDLIWQHPSKHPIRHTRSDNSPVPCISFHYVFAGIWVKPEKAGR